MPNSPATMHGFRDESELTKKDWQDMAAAHRRYESSIPEEQWPTSVNSVPFVYIMPPKVREPRFKDDGFSHIRYLRSRKTLTDRVIDGKVDRFLTHHPTFSVEKDETIVPDLVNSLEDYLEGLRGSSVALGDVKDSVEMGEWELWTINDVWTTLLRDEEGEQEGKYLQYNVFHPPYHERVNTSNPRVARTRTDPRPPSCLCRNTDGGFRLASSPLQSALKLVNKFLDHLTPHSRTRWRLVPDSRRDTRRVWSVWAPGTAAPNQLAMLQSAAMRSEDVYLLVAILAQGRVTLRYVDGWLEAKRDDGRQVLLPPVVKNTLARLYRHLVVRHAHFVLLFTYDETLVLRLVGPGRIKCSKVVHRDPAQARAVARSPLGQVFLRRMQMYTEDERVTIERVSEDLSGQLGGMPGSPFSFYFSLWTTLALWDPPPRQDLDIWNPREDDREQFSGASAGAQSVVGERH